MTKMRMDHHLLILLYTGCVIFITTKAVPACPWSCSCTGDLVECGGITSWTGMQFPPTTRSVRINGGILPYIGPNTSWNQTRHIKFVGCKIGVIKPLTFSNIPELKTLEFRASIVKRILPCGLSAINSASSISFEASMIDEIQAGGISNIAGLRNLTFFASSISTIASFGFQNVQADKVSFNDVQIDLVQPAAFTDLHDLDSFTWSQVFAKSTEAGAFYRVTDIKSVEISGFYPALKHHTLMELREATPANHQSFQFHSSRVSCDCRSAPLLAYVQQNPEAAQASVVCSMSNRRLRDVGPEEACPGHGTDSYCAEISLSSPACLAPASTDSFLVTVCPTEARPGHTDFGTTITGEGPRGTNTSSNYREGTKSRQEQNRLFNAGDKKLTHVLLIVFLFLLPAVFQRT
ncbi:SLIT homolog 1 protein [Elysia marginata]|uniref:SLIT homolog 1 protein n=1 Tax=Elysia marginata TaxID=1093978 RepID=A0AAV4ICC8_9GAST|nr:SLIT homolog 1 protein [Elysia marginata]